LDISSAFEADSALPLRNAWYFAQASEDLKRGRTLPVTILGEPILLGRDQDGTAFALADFCPHRGIPLRHGRFDGREVECAYHGWRFDTGGRCSAVPALASGQDIDLSKIKVRHYPTTETQGNIWIFIGEGEAQAPPVPVMANIEGALPKLRESVMLEGGIDDAVIGLMDPAHGPFVHRSWFWRSGRKTRDKAKRFEPSPWGFIMVRHAPSSDSRAYRILGGKPETEIVFHLPSVRWERITVGRHVMWHLTTLTPIEAKRTLITHSIYWTQAWLTPLRPLLRPIVRTFLHQDRDVMALQQEGLKYNPQLLLLGDADALARWYFRLKNEYLRARAEGRPFANPLKARTLRWRT
jgi:phenylpropionate dioxygenase-like ring-hydroxylating dioxygenase large terminal subunit